MAKRQTGASIPTDVAAEEAIVGTMLSNPNALKQAGKVLDISDFWSSEAATVFDVCVSLGDSHQEVNKESVAGELKLRGALDEVGGKDYLDKLLQVSDAVLFSSNVSIIKNLSTLRKLIYAGSKMLKDAVVPDADANVILQDLGVELGELKAKSKGVGPRIVGLEIITSNPSKYKIHFSNKEDVDISIEDLMNPKAVRQAIINKLFFVPALAKDWEKFVKQLMVNAKKSPAPASADVTIEVLDVIRDLFEARGEGKEASDLRSGSYALDEINGKQYYLFQKSAVVNYAKQQLNRNVNTAELWQLVYGWCGINEKDGKPISKRIGSGSRTQLWGLPTRVIEEGVVKKGDEIEMSADGEVDVSFLED